MLRDTYVCVLVYITQYKHTRTINECVFYKDRDVEVNWRSRDNVFLESILKSLLDSACVLSSSVMTFATLWTGARQGPLFMGFFRQEYWSGFPFSSPRGSSWPRDWSCISCVPCTAGRFFTCWAIGDAWKSLCYTTETDCIVDEWIHLRIHDSCMCLWERGCECVSMQL